jgi:hypothetical protein
MTLLIFFEMAGHGRVNPHFKGAPFNPFFSIQLQSLLIHPSSDKTSAFLEL